MTRLQNDRSQLIDGDDIDPVPGDVFPAQYVQAGCNFLSADGTAERVLDVLNDGIEPVRFLVRGDHAVTDGGRWS